MAREGLCLADALAAGLADVGVVQQPVDGRGGQSLGHQLVESGWVQVGRDRHGSFLIRGVDEPVEAFGGVLGHWEQPDVVDHDEVGARTRAMALVTESSAR